jgi:two-component system cell cycle sensor histidine kinase/response regulator CckA
MNLVMNAAEAVQTSGQVTIETFNRYVDMGNDQIPEGEYVVLRVSDTGVGIDPVDIKKIFEPFYTKKKMGRSGSGLGLSVVWNAVKDFQVEPFKGNAETILVIDDVKGQRKIAQGCLKLLGYTPFAVSSGEKAIIASGFSATNRVIEAKQLGVGQYIKKPYALQKFAFAVKKELARRN